MADTAVEHELCGNCKREIPQSNYVMHTAHCARNITLCKSCNEPIAKAKYEEHAKTCVAPVRRIPKQKTPEPPKTNLEKSPYFQSRKEVEDKKIAERKARYLERHEKFLDDTSKKLGKHPQSSSSVAGKSTEVETTLKTYQSTTVGTASRIVSNGTGAVKKEEPRSNGAVPKTSGGLMPCRYCDLELPKVELEEHENYCGSRTDKCLECGELVMFKHKQVHLDTNHGFLKLNDGPATRPRSTCKFCDTAIYYHNDLIKHISICRPKFFSRFSRMTSDSNCGDFNDPPKTTSPVQDNKNRQTGAVPKRSRPREMNLLIFCENCKTSIHQKDFTHHKTSCGPNSIGRKTSDFKFDSNKDLQVKHGAPQTGSLPKVSRPYQKTLSISREISKNNRPYRPFKNSSDFYRDDQNDFPIPESKNHVTTKSKRQRAPKSKRSTPSELSDKPQSTDGSELPAEEASSDIDETELDILVYIPCEFCNEPILADYLILHQTGCRPDLAKKEVTDEDLPTQEVKLPCEFCDELIYEFDLILHESGCMFDSARKETTVEDATTSEKLSSEFCDESKPKNDLILHEKGCFAYLVKKEVTDEDAVTPGDDSSPKNYLVLHKNGCIPDLVKKEVSDVDVATPGEKLHSEFCDERKPAEVLILRRTGCIPDLVKKEVSDEDVATPGFNAEVLILRRTGYKGDLENKEVIEEMRQHRSWD